MINKMITLSVALSLATVLMADVNIPMDKKVMSTKMKEVSHASEEKSNHKLSELVPLPHFKRLLAANKDTLKLNKEQNEKIKTQIFETLRTKIHGDMKTAEQLEVKIADAALKEQKTKEDLKADIELLIKIKRGITNGHIDALNIMAKILTKEQYAQLLSIIEKNKG